MSITRPFVPLTMAAIPDADDDRRLMERAAHDPALFAPIYERYVDRVYAYCIRRTDNAQEAEDLCSQVFARALSRLHTYRGGMVSAWLFQIAHNLVVNHYRGRRPVVALEEVEAWYEGVSESYENAEETRILKALVAALPADQRDLLALTLDAGLSSQEAGAVLGKSAGAVRVQLHRTIKLLRDRYRHITGGR